MNRNILIALPFALSCYSASAEAPPATPPSADVSILKQKVAPFRASIDTGIAQAQKLVLQMGTASTEISYDDCKELQKKIESQYPLSPFYAVYKGGASFSQFCDWNIQFPERPRTVESGMKYFIDPIQTLNQMGVPGSYLVRVLKPTGLGFMTETQFLLDGNFRILERNSRTFHPVTNTTMDWDVKSVDVQGNDFEFIGVGNGTKGGDNERASFSSADGILYGLWIKTPRRSDRGNELTTRRIYKVSTKDWMNFAQILTHLEGRYFQYTPNEWVSSPHEYDFLFEVKLAGSGEEVCADGFSFSAVSPGVSYKPSNNQDPWSCANAW